MNLKLHNKYEIKIGDKEYVAYNTLLNTIYDKISNLEQYTSHIAIGTGTTPKTSLDTKLDNYLMTFKAQTDEIQCDISKETLYIKKIVTIDESYTETFSFSELGITSSSEFDPIIYNHVLVKNQEGEVVSVTRNQGDAMEIKLTIYLELNPESKALFTEGNNYLIRQLLGDELNLENNNLYAIRGNNTISNNMQSNIVLDLTNAIACEKNIAQNEDGTTTLSFIAELGSGSTEEILLVYNNQVCVKLNTCDFNSPKELSNTFECEKENIIEIDNSVKEIKNVFEISDEQNIEHNTHNVVKYSKNLTDKVLNVFDKNFDASYPRFVSKDNKMIAFISDSYMHLYLYKDYSFTKINTNQISTDNIMKVFMFEDVVLVLRTQAPYINIYKINNNIASAKVVSMNMFDSSAYTYSWLDADATLTNNNKILIGIILNDQNQTPIVLTLTENQAGEYTDDFRRATLDTARKVYAIYKNNFSEPRVCFLTDTYDSGTYYLIEEFFENSSSFAANSDTAYDLLNNSEELFVSGRTILSQKNTAPNLIAYYYPNFETVDASFSSGIKHYTSTDGNYIISKYSDDSFKIFNLHKFNNLLEFESQFPTFVNFSEVLDFEFIGDYLLIFTNNTNESLYAIGLKNNYTRLENLTDINKKYLVEYTKYDLLGANQNEGVKLTFKIKFSLNG